MSEALDRAILNAEGLRIRVGKRGRSKRIVIEISTPKAGAIEFGTAINSQQYSALINWAGRNDTRHWADDVAGEA